MKNEIPIFFSIDDNYAPFLATAITSAKRHASTGRRYRAMILHKGISDSNKKRIESLSTDNFKVEFIEMKKELEEITDRLSNRLRFDIFTLTIYFRLFIPEMFPQYDKGIYIDSDVVLTDDIAKLFDVDLGDNYIGACRDLSISHISSLVDYTIKVIGIKKGDYINSGVLLMNMKTLREKKLSERFLELLKTYHFDSVAPDQDYLNAICNEKIYFLPKEWNTMPGETADKESSPCLIHYNLYSKPWRRDGVQYEEDFWLNAKDSGYMDEIMYIKRSFKNSVTVTDEEALAILINRAVKIKRKRVTLKRIYDSGVRVRL